MFGTSSMSSTSSHVPSSYFLLWVRAVVAHRVVVIIGLPRVRFLSVDAMAGAGWREGGEGVLGAACRQSVQ